MYKKEPFRCPECGSHESLGTSLPASAKRSRNEGTPRRCVCAQCHFEIPTHLAERWGISEEEAIKEWREVYRDLAPRVWTQRNKQVPRARAQSCSVR